MFFNAPTPTKCKYFYSRLCEPSGIMHDIHALYMQVVCPVSTILFAEWVIELQ